MNSIKKIIRKYYHEAVIVKDLNIPYEHLILTNSNNDYNGLVIIMEDVIDIDKVIGYDLSLHLFSYFNG